MFEEWSDNEPSPPSSGWRKVALYAFLITAAALVWWALSWSLFRATGI
jgi:hypothetical protein